MPMQPPRVDPVGVVESPEGWVRSPRRHGAPLRVAAALLLAAFLAVGTATTVWSLGAWCLTSHAGSEPRTPR